MSIRVTFCNSISLAVIDEYDKGAGIQISTMLGDVYRLLVEASSELELFRHLSNQVFRVPNFGNTKALRVIFFFKISKFKGDFKNTATNSEKTFCFLDN